MSIPWDVITSPSDAQREFADAFFALVVKYLPLDWRTTVSVAPEDAPFIPTGARLRTRIDTHLHHLELRLERRS